MKISSNYNLSFNQKVNNQQSKTNPSFGISTKNLTIPLAAGTGAIYGATHKLMPAPAEIFLPISDKKTQKNKDSGLADLPTDKYGYTKLHLWCKNGNFEKVKKFLDENPNINLSQRTKDGNTCMFLAAKFMRTDIVDLIANTDNYKPDIPDNKYGWTDLHHLCYEGYTDTVKTILEKHPNIDINQKTKDGDTCMSIAINNWQKDLINIIAGMDNYDPTIPDDEGWTELHRLCSYEYTDIIKALLEKYPEFDINQKTNGGDTCMSLAIKNEYKDTINLIAGMDNYNPVIPDENGWTDLHYLCQYGYTDAVKTILEKHPELNINQQTEDGDTCMSLAALYNKEEIVNLIAGRNNYNPTIPDENGRTDLHRLCQKGYTDLVKTLLEKHPEFNINQQTEDGDTCMSLAIDNEQKDTINLIAGTDSYNPAIPDDNGWTDLHYLCKKGYTDVVKTLLEKHPEFDINLQTKYGLTCMSLAISNEHKDIINLIAGMDKYNPTIPDEEGWTDLHYLCKEGYTDVVKTLLEKHPEFDINQPTKYGWTCMFLAISNEHKDIINLIAGRDNYNPTIADEDGWTDLHRLCTNGYTDVVKTLLEKHPDFNINQQTRNGDTCMSLAVRNGHEDIINLIAGMDNYNQNIPDEDGWTDFHRLCYRGYTDVVKTLLEKHPDINFNQQTKNGETCMTLAIDNEQKDTINLIAGTDSYNPTIANEDGWTDLHCLCKEGYTDVVKTLLEKHPEFDINQQTEDGYNCIYLAAINKQEEIVNLIAGMDNYNPNIPDDEGWTDLHWLCGNGYTDAVKTLLEKHPEFDINQQTEDGETCMSLAIDYGNEDIINLIAGMDNYKPDIPDKKGWTDLHRLCDSNRKDALEKIIKDKPDININQFTNDGYSCMTIAVSNGNKDLASLIAGFKNYNPLIINKFGANDLHYLCRNGYTEAVKTILDNNPDIDINQLTTNGLSYIDLAKSNNHTDTVKIILEKLPDDSPEKQALYLAENDSAKPNAGKETDYEAVKSVSWTGKLMKKVAKILRL